MAVIYSKLGGCLGVTAKFGPLARTDLWAGVKGLLDKLMTHLGLGSSLEDPWGSLLGAVGVELPSQELALSAWEAALFSWEALCLVEWTLRGKGKLGNGKRGVINKRGVKIKTLNQIK